MQLILQLAASVGFIDPALCTQISLVVFFLVFVGTAAWTLTRRRSEIEDWSNLPLHNGDERARAAAGEEAL